MAEIQKFSSTSPSTGSSDKHTTIAPQEKRDHREDQRRFEAELDKHEQEKTPGHGAETPSSPSESLSITTNLPASELIRPQQQAAELPTSPLAAPITTSTASEKLGKLLALVEQAWLSKTETTSTEIRLKINQQLLPNTEIRISEQHNQLNVNFISEHPTAFHWLASEGARLALRLSTRLRRDIVVTIKDGESIDSEVSQYRSHYTKEQPGESR